MTAISRRSMLAGAATTAAVATMPGLPDAFAAAPPIGKQAPGFYRYKVGTMEVTAVTDGATSAPLADTYIANQSKDAVNAALGREFYQTDRNVTSYTPVVVNTGSKLVVLDTGVGPAVFEQSKGAFGQFQTNLAAAGIDRNTVDTVIISHFHGDHIGGLLSADGKPHYPNAEVMVPAAEWAYFMDDGNMSRAPDAMKGTFTAVRRIFGALGKDVTRYDGGKELVPGITSISTPGHTLGHTSHILASGSDKVFVQADITAGMAFLFVKNPEWQLMFDMDKPLAVQTRRKMYDMAIAEKMPIQGYHFNFPAAAYVEKDGNGYRLQAVPWKPNL